MKPIACRLTTRQWISRDGPPGSCAIDLVRDDTTPLWSLVCVIDLLQVPPPSLAIALAWALVAFGLTFDCEEALPFAAAATAADAH
jgi:hypothetical protein